MSKSTSRSKLPSKHKRDFKVGDVLAGMDSGERWQLVQPVIGKLSTAQQTLYLYLHAILNSERGDDRHSARTLASKEHLGWSESYFKQVASELVALGLIERHQEGRHGVTAMLMPPESFYDRLRGTPERTPATRFKGSTQAARGVRPSGLRGTPQHTETRKEPGREPGEPQTPSPRSTGRMNRANESAEPIDRASEASQSSSTKRKRRSAQPPARSVHHPPVKAEAETPQPPVNQVDSSRAPLVPAQIQRNRSGKRAVIRVGANGRSPEPPLLPPERILWKRTSGTYDERLAQMKAFIVEHKPSPQELVHYDGAVGWLGFEFDADLNLVTWPDWFDGVS